MSAFLFTAGEGTGGFINMFVEYWPIYTRVTNSFRKTRHAISQCCMISGIILVFKVKDH